MTGESIPDQVTQHMIPTDETLNVQDRQIPHILLIRTSTGWQAHVALRWEAQAHHEFRNGVCIVNNHTREP